MPVPVKKKPVKAKPAGNDWVAAAAATNLPAARPTTDLHVNVPDSAHSGEDKAFISKVISLLLLLLVSALAIWLAGSST